MNIFTIFGLAEREKIHSVIISWFLHAQEVSNESKNKFLSVLFDQTCALKEIKSMTEYKKIDIIIEGDDTHVFMIENKLKSSQHTNQLTRYTEIIEKDPKYQHMKKTSIFLTLIGELSQNPLWKAKTYKDLYNALTYLESINEDVTYLINQYKEAI
jgi:hypothetical protein